MGRLYGVVQHTPLGAEYLRRGTTLEKAKWTFNRDNALRVNTERFADRLGERFGGQHVVLRGMLAEHVTQRPETTDIYLPPSLYADLMEQLGLVWGHGDTTKSPNDVYEMMERRAVQRQVDTLGIVATVADSMRTMVASND